MKDKRLLGGSCMALPFVKIIGASLKVFWLLCRERSRADDVIVNWWFEKIINQMISQTKDLLTEKKI